MKQLKFGALVILMACWGAALAQDKQWASSAPAQSATGGAAASEKGAKLTAKAKAEAKHKAYLERRKAAETSREAVATYVRMLRNERAKDVVKERAALKARKDMGRTPGVAAVEKKAEPDKKP